MTKASLRIRRRSLIQLTALDSTSFQLLALVFYYPVKKVLNPHQKAEASSLKRLSAKALLRDLCSLV